MKIQRPLLIVPILFILSLAACNASTQPTLSAPSPTPTFPQTQTQTIEASPTKSPTDTATPADTATPIDTAPHAVEPITGVVYQIQKYHGERTNKSLLSQIGENGVAHVILQGNNIKFSPDQKQAIYQSYNQYTNIECTLFTDFVKKEGKSLVCPSEGQTTQILGWTTNDPSTVYGIFNMVPVIDGGLGSIGTMSLTDGAIHLIDSEHPTGDARLSPDGQSIAYSSFDSKTEHSTGWLYSKTSGVVALSSKNYPTGAYPDISNPAWSPDSQKIAWGMKDHTVHQAIGVFDLTKKTAIILHPSLRAAGTLGEAGAPSPTWSPDGQWISAGDQWVIGADGQKEYQFDGNIIGWSPDSQWVLYAVPDESQRAILELRAAHLDGTQTFKLGFVKFYYYDTFLWSQNGQQLLFLDKDQKVQLVDVQTWKSHDVTSSFQYDSASATVSLLAWVQPIPVSLESMTILPTYTPQPVFDCLNAPTSRLKVGDHGRITFLDGSTTRLRSAPEAGENVLSNLAEGTEFDVVDGPVCYPRPGRSDAYIYWKVMVPSVNKVGWLAEGDQKSYYLEP